MQQNRSVQLTNFISYAMRTCFAEHPEWFVSGDLKSIEHHLQTTLKPLLNIPMQLSFNDGWLACAKHIIHTPSA
jgi:hypothetical protein